MTLPTSSLRDNSRLARLTRSIWCLLLGNCGMLLEALSRRLHVIAFIARRWRLRVKAGAWREPISKLCARAEKQACLNVSCTVAELFSLAYISSTLDIRYYVERCIDGDMR